MTEDVRALFAELRKRKSQEHGEKLVTGTAEAFRRQFVVTAADSWEPELSQYKVELENDGHLCDLETTDADGHSEPRLRFAIRPKGIRPDQPLELTVHCLSGSHRVNIEALIRGQPSGAHMLELGDVVLQLRQLAMHMALATY